MKKNTTIALATLLLGSGQAARSQSPDPSDDPTKVTSESDGGASLDADAIRRKRSMR